MDERIEAFLKDVLALEGQDSNLVREGVRIHLEKYENQFRDAETNKRMKDTAGDACRKLCRARVVAKKLRCRGTLTAVHLNIVLSVIDGSAGFQ
jgi:hypothetical protein